MIPTTTIDDTINQDALVSGQSPWGGRMQRPRHQPLADSIKVDVAVIGGGITGALAAEHLSLQGHSVCVIEREQAGLGSTHASTAMLQWEIDSPMSDLSRYYGFDKAAGIYRRSRAAAAGLSGLITAHNIACNYAPRSTLCLVGAGSSAQDLLAEFRLRERGGLPGQYLSYTELLTQFGMEREAAILSPGSAEADPLMLCWALLGISARRGARLVDAMATGFDEEGGHVTVQTDGKYVVEAKQVVLATGYVMPQFVMPKLHTTASTWALATVPQKEQSLWPQRALIWEDSDPYLYARTTADNRIVVGGEDEEIADPALRDSKLPEKIATIREKMKHLWPKADMQIDYTWCGAFGETSDGLPLIGRVPGTGRIYAAYGYGGNGITFSFMASRMIAASIAGKAQKWFDDFAIERDDPTGGE